MYLVFSGLAANIRKSIPLEVQSGFSPLPLSHHFKTKLKCQNINGIYREGESLTSSTAWRS